MAKYSGEAKPPESRAGGRALWLAGGLWGLWVVLPSVMLGAAAGKPSAARAFIEAQVGPGTVSYLGSAPHAALTFLLLSYLLALAPLILLVQQVRRVAAGPISGGELATLVLRRVGAFAALYLAGSAVVAALMRARGVPSLLVWGWVPRLALYGLITALPQLGWVFAVGLIVRRLWPSLAVTLLGALVCASASHVLTLEQVTFPSPMFLRAELLSGSADAVLPASAGLLLWGLGLVLAGVGIRALRARRLWRAGITRAVDSVARA
jgi:hypothetical protein